MNRKQLHTAVSAEIRNALKTYDACVQPTQITDLISTGVLGAIRSKCLIETVEQLEALPVGAVIRADGPVIFLRELNGAAEPAWFARAEYFSYDAVEIPLPALLIWHPSWTPAPPRPPEPVSGEVSATDVSAAVVPW